MDRYRRLSRCALTVASILAALNLHALAAGLPDWPIMPEERAVRVRNPSCLCKARIPAVGNPLTVESPDEVPEQFLSLDNAIRIALDNTDVVRVLAGVGAVASGRTIYDAPIASTVIDETRGRFDPAVSAGNSFDRFERPDAIFDPGDMSRALIVGDRSDDYNLDFDLAKTSITGGIFNFGVNTTPTRLQPDVFPLNPRNRSSLELSFTQPLLQGGGLAANRAPIVIARIDTERSFFRFKDSMQQLVRGVIDAYWALVFARVDLWAREQQVEQAQWAYERADARDRKGLDDQGDVAQTEVALANFRASLVTAKANVLLREAALRNILGLPPASAERLVPSSTPRTDKLPIDWDGLVIMAEQQRPDVIELKLILEADQQLLLQANNQALPQVDAVALYRWNGLEGEMPIGDTISTRPGEYTDWTLGVNFSVPLGLRAARAGLRRQQLVIARDRANLDQGMHNAVHSLSVSVQNLASLYAQYEAFRLAREAARKNLDAQFAQYRADQVIFLNVLQAITSWGNAVSAEAQSLALYNTELANLERETGTILDTHGITFMEERFGSIGPLGRIARPQCYPKARRPSSNAERYPVGEGPAEESFDLSQPYSLRREAKPELVPVPGVE